MLRLGSRDAWFISASSANNFPLAAGGGLFDLGLGFTGNKPRSLYWIGLGGGPYDGIALSLKDDFPLSSNFILGMRTQVASRDAFENGIAVGGKLISERACKLSLIERYSPAGQSWRIICM